MSDSNSLQEEKVETVEDTDNEQVEEEEEEEEFEQEATLNTGLNEQEIATNIKQGLGSFQDFSQHSKENIEHNYSNQAFVGIRGLPYAFHPNYRQLILQEILKYQRYEQVKRKMKLRAKKYELAASLNGSPLSIKIAPGQRAHSKYSTFRSWFSTFEHMFSDYESQRKQDTQRRLQSREKENQISNGNFIVKCTENVPWGSGAFNEFQYHEDPFENCQNINREEYFNQLMKIIAGGYRPPGKATPKEKNKTLVDELMVLMSMRYHQDWPKSFLQIFEDETGCIVVSFDKENVGKEGDVTTYMNQNFRTDFEVDMFGLVKDSSKWGITTSESPSVYYVYWPPWARHKKLIPNKLMGHVPLKNSAQMRRRTLLSRESTRDPFGQTTDAGLLQSTCTRSLQNTMRY